MRQLFRRIDQFLCIGSANRRLYQRYGISDARLHSAPYCVDNDRLREAAQLHAPNRDDLRRRWNIPRESYCILFCGKFVNKKHPLDLIQAVELLLAGDARSLPQIHLAFVGNGELLPEIRAACQLSYDLGRPTQTSSNDNKPSASVIGFLNQSQITEAYSAADLLVLPSDAGETWGLVVNEAMASGIPAIVSHLCGCAEDLPARLDPRLVFRFGEIADLAAAIQYAISADFSSDQIAAAVDRHHLRETVATVESLYATAIPSTVQVGGDVPRPQVVA
jgi:glycosyltransferase involved in cell wall biosynthesis